MRACVRAYKTRLLFIYWNLFSVSFPSENGWNDNRNVHHAVFSQINLSALRMRLTNTSFHGYHKTIPERDAFARLCGWFELKCSMQVTIWRWPTIKTLSSVQSTFPFPNNQMVHCFHWLRHDVVTYEFGMRRGKKWIAPVTSQKSFTTQNLFNQISVEANGMRWAVQSLFYLLPSVHHRPIASIWLHWHTSNNANVHNFIIAANHNRLDCNWKIGEKIALLRPSRVKS